MRANDKSIVAAILAPPTVLTAILILSCKDTPPEPPPRVREAPEVAIEPRPAAEVDEKDNLLLLPGVTLEASSHNQETERVERLIDGRPATIWHVAVDRIGRKAWVRIDFGEGDSRRVRRLAARPRRDLPEQFFRLAELYGSADGESWDLLAEIVQNEPPPDNPWLVWSFDNPGSYRFYRLDIIDGHGGRPGDKFLSMAGLALFE